MRAQRERERERERERDRERYLISEFVLVTFEVFRKFFDGLVVEAEQRQAERDAPPLLWF